MKSRWFRPRNIVIAAIILLVIVGVTVAVKAGGSKKAEAHTVQRDVVRQEVAVSGSVKSDQTVNLGFAQSGRIGQVNVRVGNRVSQGQVLVTLENQDVYADQLHAQARLQAAQATLREVQRGTRPEELAVSEKKKEAAESDVNEAHDTLAEVMLQAHADAVNAVTNNADLLFNRPTQPRPTLKFTTQSSVQRERIQKEREALNKVFSDWNRVNSTLSSNNTEQILPTIEANLVRVRTFINDLANAVNTARADEATPQSTLNEYKNTVVAARDAILGAIADVQAAEGAVDAVQADLAVAERELALAKAGSTREDIEAEQAAVTQAQAELTAAQAEYAKTIIRAPFSGVVTTLDVERGEIVGANQTIVTVIADDVFIIETNIPEVDIAKIAVGNRATVTLDAYGETTTFPASVVLIEPAAVQIEGVPTYKTTLQFSQRDERIRAGMTANVTIHAAERTDVIAVPLRALAKNDQNQDTVMVQIGEKIEETEERVVTIGIRGSNGMAEVLNGLTEGEVVVIGE
jgi:HlyD family secretion protein